MLCHTFWSKLAQLLRTISEMLRIRAKDREHSRRDCRGHCVHAPPMDNWDTLVNITVCAICEGTYRTWGENANSQHTQQGHDSTHQLDYTALTGLPACAVKPLQVIRNAAAAQVFNQPKYSHVPPLISLHWLPAGAHIKFMSPVLAFVAANGTAPTAISPSTVSKWTSPGDSCTAWKQVSHQMFLIHGS